MNEVDLRLQDRQAILKLAEAILPSNATLLAYGSRVKGTNHDASDLNLAIKTPSDDPLSLDQLANFQFALQESTIPILIQVFDWHRLPQSFQANIAVQHAVLWQGESA